MAYDENIYAKIVSGTLTTQEEQRLKDSGEWDEIQAILEASSDLKLPTHNLESGYSKLHALKSKKTAKGSIKKLYAISIGLAAVVVLAIGFLFIFQGEGSQQTADYGQNAKFALKDKTKVVLNDGSSLNYAHFMDENRRTVELKGEGFFEVIPGNKFVVKTENGSVEVLGTAFNVRSWGASFEVECYSGRVAIIADGQRQEISKGQSVRLNEGKFTEIEKVESNEPLWMQGMSKFSNVALGEVFKELERQYNIEIQVPEIDEDFNGAFQHENLKKALEEICIPMGLSIDIINKNSVVVSE